MVKTGVTESKMEKNNKKNENYNRGLQSVVRTCNIIECISENESGATVKEIAGILNLNLSTCYHIIRSLEWVDFVRLDPVSRKYYLGPKFHKICQGWTKNNNLINIARPYLERINRTTQETVYLAEYRNNKILIIDSIEGMHHLRTSGFPYDIGFEGHGIGFAGHDFARASGKIILANINPQKVEQYFANNDLVKLTDKTITDKSILKNQLEECRKRGYAVDDEEFSEGVCCVAVPVFNSQNEAIAAIAVSFPVTRKKNLDSIIEVLLEIGPQVSKEVAKMV